MKKLLLLGAAVLALAATALTAQSCSQKVQAADYEVIPQPQQVEAGQGEPFKLSGSTVIAIPAGNEELQRDADFLAQYVEQMTGNRLKIVTDQPDNNAIVLCDQLENENPEAYELTVNADQIKICGASPAGTFYGIQTLRKSIPVAEKCDVEFPPVKIADYPRFAYRGAHLDVGRHFFTVDSIKQFVDMLALHNMNRMHWHLTEDQGWRIEIKSLPELTEKGSMRSGTMIGKDFNSSDSIPYGGFYTQDEVKDIIQYAKDRYITIIPEIDLPGHMLGALTAYPELGCTGGPYEPWTRWGVSEDVLCAGNDSTYKFLDTVLDEIVELFPSEYIHVGGDECPKTRWAECPKCQAKIKQLGLKADQHGSKEEKLQSYVIHHVSDYLASKGRKTIGWDEILEGGLAPGAVVMSWRGEAGGIEAAKQDHDVIMTPNTYLYFDYYQSQDTENEPLAIGGYLPVKTVYNYEPTPADHFTPEEAAHIIGVQANIWTEYMPTFSQVEYMALPRYAALAEVQWTEPDKKDYEKFVKRLPQMMAQYDANGYNYAKHVMDATGNIAPDAEAGEAVLTLTTADGAPIVYTLDGTEPTEQSQQYSEPVKLKESAVVKARALRNGQLEGRVYADSVAFSKATFRPVTLVNEPAGNFKGDGPQTLTNGIYGSRQFNNRAWMGFYGNNLEAIIDLGSEQEVSEVKLRCCIDTGSWVFDARSMSVFVAQTDQKWQQVFTEEYPAMTENFGGVVSHVAKFPAVKAQIVKVVAAPEGTIPDWHQGKGAKGFLFVDEIEVN